MVELFKACMYIQLMLLTAVTVRDFSTSSPLVLFQRHNVPNAWALSKLAANFMKVSAQIRPTSFHT
jgi:hypothetical protein